MTTKKAKAKARAKANTGVSPLRRKRAPSVEMTSSGVVRAEYRGLSTAAHTRAFGRDDEFWGGAGRIQGSLHCGANARLRSR